MRLEALLPLIRHVEEHLVVRPLVGVELGVEWRADLERRAQVERRAVAAARAPARGVARLLEALREQKVGQRRVEGVAHLPLDEGAPLALRGEGAVAPVEDGGHARKGAVAAVRDARDVGGDRRERRLRRREARRRAGRGDGCEGRLHRFGRGEGEGGGGPGEVAHVEELVVGGDVVGRVAPAHVAEARLALLLVLGRVLVQEGEHRVRGLAGRLAREGARAALEAVRVGELAVALPAGVADHRFLEGHHARHRLLGEHARAKRLVEEAVRRELVLSEEALLVWVDGRVVAPTVVGARQLGRPQPARARAHARAPRRRVGRRDGRRVVALQSTDDRRRRRRRWALAVAGFLLALGVPGRIAVAVAAGDEACVSELLVREARLGDAALAVGPARVLGLEPGDRHQPHNGEAEGDHAGERGGHARPLRDERREAAGHDRPRVGFGDRADPVRLLALGWLVTGLVCHGRHHADTDVRRRGFL